MNEDRIVEIALIVGIIAVIVLKITNVIKISWLLLLSPIWFTFGVGIVIAIFVLIVIIISCVKEKK